MAETLLLCHSSRRPGRLAGRLRAEGESIKWIFLGQDYLRLVDWQSGIGPWGQYVEIGARLNDVAAQLRGPFLTLITELGRRYQSIGWWASRLAERNTMVSPLFLYCCYQKLGEDFLQAEDGKLGVVSESWDVLESLARFAKQKRVRTIWISRPVPLARTLIFLARSARRLSRFAVSSIGQRCADSAGGWVKPDRPSILLRTWVDDACFGVDGFRDRYLPGLSKWLTERNYSVATIPVLFNLRRSLGSAWKWLRSSGEQFLNPFAYYRLSDYLFALHQAGRQLRSRAGAIELAATDVTRLFAAEQKREFLDDSCIESILSYRLPKRLAEQGYHVDIMIDEFENMVPDKLLNLGFRRYLPTTKLVGFQHGALFPLLLCNFVTAGEATFAPMPDRVVCNGEFFRDVLISEGLPRELTRVGPALRYDHLMQLISRDGSEASAKGNLLVPLPLVLDSAVELLMKVLSAVAPLSDLRILLKAHPMSSPEIVLRAAKRTGLPSNVEFVQSSMSELLGRSTLVVALSSSTVHEALAAGVPVIVVGRETALDLNPLGWYPDLNQVARSAEELRATIITMLSLSPEALQSYKKRAQEVLSSSFARVTDESMHAFIDGLVTASRGALAREGDRQSETPLMRAEGAKLNRTVVARRHPSAS